MLSFVLVAMLNCIKKKGHGATARTSRSVIYAEANTRHDIIKITELALRGVPWKLVDAGQSQGGPNNALDRRPHRQARQAHSRRPRSGRPGTGGGHPGIVENGVAGIYRCAGGGEGMTPKTKRAIDSP